MIHTKRLNIYPLSKEEVELYLLPGNQLEKKKGFNIIEREVPEPLKDAIEATILASYNLGGNSLFYTLWTVVSKEHHSMIGDLFFKGEPINGSVEIAYGTYDAFQGKGYMTEAVSAMIDWAFQHDEVKEILAETEKHNIASQRILIKNGFEKMKETADMLWWRIVRK
jgi:[ribosomal protein S5]-alanine N-acetyltransferase